MISHAKRISVRDDLRCGEGTKLIVKAIIVNANRTREIQLSEHNIEAGVNEIITPRAVTLEFTSRYSNG